MNNIEKMIEEITDRQNWVFKLRRLAGKDYIASFTLLKRKGLEPKEFVSPPLSKMEEAIGFAYNKAIAFIKRKESKNGLRKMS